MAKVQAKKAAAAAKKTTAKKAAGSSKSASARKKAPRKPIPPAKRPSKTAKSSKPAKVAKAAVKPVAKAAKAVAKAAKPVAKAVAAERVAKTAKTVAKVAAVAAAIPVAAKAAKAIAHRAGAEGEATDKKRARRPRTRIASAGTAVANWFVQEKPRPSSFIPAPPRAEAPSLVAAPPASSDRLIRPEDLTQAAVRTVPVRIDIEQGGGRVFIAVSPIEVTLRPNEGIEWDFRYLGGSDVIVDEVLIEFDRPSPFGAASFRSKRPGAARPHRQLSGGAGTNSAGKRFQYTIRAMNGFKTELATARPSVHILLA